MSGRFVQTVRGAAGQVTRAILILLVIVTTIFVVVCIFAVPTLVDNVQAASRSAELSNCRAQARLPYERAQQHVDDLTAQANDTQAATLEAALGPNKAEVARLGAQLAVERHQTSLAASDATASYNSYADRVQLAVTSPDLFLDQCHTQAGG